MWRFLTGVKPPPQKKAKLSETDARYKKEKTKREPQQTWKDKRRLFCAVESKCKVKM